MDAQILVLRILHIVLGTFWIGTDIFYSFFLVPQLRALGAAIERPVIKSILRPLTVAIMVSALTTLVTGVLLISKMRGWSTLFASGWGLSIFIGLVLTGIALFVVGFGLILPITTRIQKLNRVIDERPLTADESRQMDDLAHRELVLSRANSVLLVIVVVTMAIARFV
jgi:uncharacterized membrane protein